MRIGAFDKCSRVLIKLQITTRCGLLLVMHSKSLTRGGEENVPGIPGTWATRNFAYPVRGPCWRIHKIKNIFITSIYTNAKKTWVTHILLCLIRICTFIIFLSGIWVKCSCCLCEHSSCTCIRFTSPCDKNLGCSVKIDSEHECECVFESVAKVVL